LTKLCKYAKLRAQSHIRLDERREREPRRGDGDGDETGWQLAGPSVVAEGARWRGHGNRQPISQAKGIALGQHSGETGLVWWSRVREVACGCGLATQWSVAAGSRFLPADRLTDPSATPTGHRRGNLGCAAAQPEAISQVKGQRGTGGYSVAGSFFVAGGGVASRTPPAVPHIQGRVPRSNTRGSLNARQSLPRHLLVR